MLARALDCNAQGVACASTGTPTLLLLGAEGKHSGEDCTGSGMLAHHKSHKGACDLLDVCSMLLVSAQLPPCNACAALLQLI